MNISFGKTLSIFIFFLFVNLAWSANYYVSTTGVDGVGYGSAVGTPYRTLVYLFANKNLNAGDIVYLAAGTYTEKTITVGSNDEGFTLQGEALSSGVPTTIFDSDQTSFWMHIDNAACDNIVINNITIKDYIATTLGGSYYGGGGVKIFEGITGTTFNNCKFDNCDANIANSQGGAIFSFEGFSAYDCVFTNCYSKLNGGAVSIGRWTIGDLLESQIYRCKFYSNTNEGGGGGNNGTAFSYSSYYAFSSSSPTKNIVKFVNSLFYSNGDNSSAGSGAIYIQYGKGLIYNSTITANQGRVTGGLYTTTNGFLDVVNSIIYNNTNYYSGKGDVYAENSSSNVSLVKCLLTSSSPSTISSVGTNSSPIYGNPKFAGIGSDPYMLLSTSPCVNAGTSSSGGVAAPANDILSGNRVLAPDIGAYESNSTPAALPIELLAFTGSCVDDYIQLDWTTATEKNNAYFSVYKSNADGNMILIGTVQGAMNSTTTQSYNFRDFNRDKEQSWQYYELVQTDIDGNTELVKSIVVSSCKSEDAFNLVKHGENLTVLVKDHHNIPVHLLLYNTIGQQIFEQSFVPDASNYSTTFTLPISNQGSVIIVQMSSVQDALNTKIAF